MTTRACEKNGPFKSNEGLAWTTHIKMNNPQNFAKEMEKMTQMLGGMAGTVKQTDIEISQPKPESYDKADLFQSDRNYLRFNSGRVDREHEQLILDTKIKSTSGARLLWVWEGLKTGAQVIDADKVSKKIVGDLNPGALDTARGTDIGCLYVLQSEDSFNLKVKIN